MALLLVLAAMPALSAIRSDQALAPVVYGAAPPRQDWARVASDGTNFFAVWRTPVSDNSYVIGGGRISPDGELLDRPSILFASGVDGDIGTPDVVFVGGNFLVAYQSGTSLITRRFSRDGRPLEPQTNRISNASMAAPLATNGKTVFLLTARNRFRLLAPDGTPLAFERDIPNAGTGFISVASNGDRYLVAYSDNGGSGSGRYVIVDSNGIVQTSRLMNSASRVAAASDGSRFLIVTATLFEIDCQVVDAATGDATTLRRAAGGLAIKLFVSWSGSEYTIVWSGASDPRDPVAAARVDAAGVPLDSAPVTISPPQSAHLPITFASASNGRDTMIIVGVYDINRAAWRTSAIIFKSLPQFDAEPPNRRNAAIASSAVEQASSSIASNGTLSLVTWRESTGPDRAAVRAAFIAADGQLGSPIDLGDADSQTATATVSNGRDFFVAYVDALGRLVARRLTLEGVLDSTPIVMTPFGFTVESIAAGWSGQAYVVATTGLSAITISSVAPDGTVIIDRQLIKPDDPPDSPAVSCATAGCSVTWRLAPSKCFFPDCGFAAQSDLLVRTTPTGNVISQVLLAHSFGLTAALSLSVANDNSLFLYSLDRNLFAGRITAGGSVLETPPVNGGRSIMTSETAYPLLPVAVVNNGLYFVEPSSETSGRLFWTEVEPEPTAHVRSLTNLHQNVALRSILPSFTVPLQVTLAASARNTYLVYSRGEDDATLMAPRLFLRTLASPDPQPSPIRRHAAR